MIRRILLTILSLIVLLILFIMFLTTSQAGLNTSIYFAKKILPGTLSIGSAKGRILGQLNINTLRYTNKETSITLSNMELDWKPSSLFSGRIYINKFYLYGLNAHLPQPTKEKKTEKKSSSAISLPIAFTINAMDLHHISIQQGDTAPFNIQHINLAAYSQGKKIHIKKMKFDSAPYSLSAKGKITLGSNYKTDISGKIVNSAQYFTNVITDFSLKGDKNKVLFTAKTNAPYKAQVTAEIDNPLHYGKINIQGSWNKILWPLGNKQFIYINQGNIAVNGTLKNYHTTLATSIQGSEVPATGIQLNGNGSWQDFNLQNLKLTTLSGNIIAQGKVTWNPNLKWQFTVAANHLNPATHWNSWPADINFKTTTHGNSKGDQLDYQFKLLSLTGNIHQLPLSGQSTIDSKNTVINISSTYITAGSNHFQIAGILNKIANLQWNIGIKQLHIIDKQASGSIISKGSISGETKKPKIVGDLNINALKIMGLNISALTGQANADFYQNTPSSISVSGKDISYQQFNIKQLKLSLAGNHVKQSGNFNMQTPYGHLNFAINSQLTKGVLNGDLTQLNFISKDYGAWHLKAPALFKVDGKQFSIAPFCWSSTHGSVCGGGYFNTINDWAAKLNIKQFNLGMFKTFIPQNLAVNAALNTDINLKTNADGDIRGDALISFPRASLGITVDKKKQVITFVNTFLKANISDKGLTGQLNVNDAARMFPLQATIKMPGYKGHGMPKISDKLQAHIIAHWPTLRFLNGFVPHATNINGQVNANLNIDGDIASPKIKGNLSINNFVARLEKFGVTITGSNFAATANGTNKLNLKGQINVNNKPIVLNGFTTLSPTFTPSELTIHGSDVNVYNTPEYKVFISPDLKLAYTAPDIRVTGTLNIPQALLKPKDFTSTVELPSSVIIEGINDENEKSNLKMFVNMRILLGKKINIQYAGLNADLEGDLEVNVAPDELPTGTGTLKVSKGFYAAYGQRLDIRNGVLMFTGGPLSNPGLNILAVKTIKIQQFGQALAGSGDDITVGVQVSGTMNRPKLSLYSSPSQSQSNTLSYLVFGQASDSISDSKFAALGQAAGALGVGGGGVTDNLKDQLGLSSLGVESSQVVNPDNNQTEQNSSFVVGKKLSRRLSVSYSIGILVPVNVLTVRYMINKSWTAQSDASTYGTGADILYTISTN